MEYEWAEQLENMDSKPAATAEPIKTAHLSNPFNKDAFLETLYLPVIVELNLIRDGTPRTIEGGTIPKPLLTERRQKFKATS